MMMIIIMIMIIIIIIIIIIIRAIEILRQTCPVSLRLTQIPHGLAWDQTQTFNVRLATESLSNGNHVVLSYVNPYLSSA